MNMQNDETILKNLAEHFLTFLYNNPSPRLKFWVLLLSLLLLLLLLLFSCLYLKNVR